jgi:hypothetical protein
VEYSDRTVCVREFGVLTGVLLKNVRVSRIRRIHDASVLLYVVVIL